MAQITLNSTGVASNGALILQSNGTTSAVTIDTSQRAAFVAGTAALPAITTTGDTNTGIFFPAADTIAFSEGGAEAMRIDTSGNVLVGVTSATSGGGVLQVSNGITFPATQSASANVNTLDDYEEGTWTPTFSFSTNGDLSVTYTTQVGSYTKIGNTVRLAFNIVTSAFTHTTASGNAQIGTLPFSGANVTGLRQYGSIQLNGITKANYTQASPYAEVNDVTIRIQAWGSGQAVSNITAADMPTAGTIWLRGIIVYQTAT